jgi:hypothetical protein
VPTGPNHKPKIPVSSTNEIFSPTILFIYDLYRRL